MKKSMSQSCPPSALPSDRRFGYRFNMIARALGQHILLHVSREHRLNLAEYRILSTLANRVSPSVKDIALHAQLDKAQVTRALAELIGRGLVAQIVDSRDRRLRKIELTQAGQAVVEAILPFSIERQRRLEKSLTKEELQVLWKALLMISEET